VFVQTADSEMPSRALSIEVLAGHLRRELGDSIEVRLWDLQLTPPEVALAEIAEFGPEVVGASVPISCMPLARDLLPAFRALHSEPLIVIGNLVATNAPAELLEALPWAVLVRGEGEEPLAELLKRRCRGDHSLHGISGVCFRGANGRTHISAIHTGTVFGSHAMDLWPQLLAAGGQVLVESSRGCPARCSFCSSRALHPHGWRRRPLHALAAELRDLGESGVSRVFFADDDFVGGGWGEAIEAADTIEAAIPGLVWGTALRADSVSQLEGLEGLRALAHRGMRDVLVGIESGSPGQLRRFRKRANMRKNEIAVQRLQSVSSINLLAGFLLDPLMSLEEITETARFVLDNHLWPSISNPLQIVEVHFGTQLAGMVETAGIRGEFDLDTMIWSTAWLHPDAERAIEVCRGADAIAAPTRKAVQRRYRSLTRRAVGSAAAEDDRAEAEWLGELLAGIKHWQIEHMWRTASMAATDLDHCDVLELLEFVERAARSADITVRQGAERSQASAKHAQVGGGRG
jgi:hypothetical protein